MVEGTEMLFIVRTTNHIQLEHIHSAFSHNDTNDGEQWMRCEHLAQTLFRSKTFYSRPEYLRTHTRTQNVNTIKCCLETKKTLNAETWLQTCHIASGQ